MTLLCLFSLVLVTASAYDVGAARVITLDDCLTVAKENSPVLKQTGLGLRAAGLARQELSTTGLPQLRFSAGAGYAPATTHFGYDPAISNEGQFGSQVILEQPVLDFGRRRLKEMQGDLDISRSTKEQQLALRDLEFEVRRSFIENLRAERDTRLREQSVIQLTEYLDLVKRLNAGGLVPYTDLLKTQVDLVTASTALSQSRQASTEARYELAALMGSPSDTTFLIADSLGEFAPLRVDSANLKVAPDTNQNLELSMAQLEYERSATEITEVQKERLPTVSFVADAGWLTSRENLMLPASERYGGLGYSVGLSLDIPLIDWGGQKLRLQQKQLAAQSTRLQTDIIRRTYETEYRGAVARLTSTRFQLKALREAILQAEDNFLLTKSKYAAGGASATDVLSAQQLLTDTQVAEVETISDIQSVLAKIARLTGN